MKRQVGWFVSSPLRLLLLPYAIGVVWHFGFHPRASVLTGDFKNPRRWYIDENSLDPSHFQTAFAKYDVLKVMAEARQSNEEAGSTTSSVSLCQSISNQQASTGLSIPCHQYDVHSADGSSSSSSSRRSNIASLEIVKIVPLSAGVSPVTEAIVLVVPPFVPMSMMVQQKTLVYASISSGSSNTTSTTADSITRAQFQASLLQLIQRLASPQTSPWLAKTILIVSPIVNNNEKETTTMPRNSMSPILEDAVSILLDSHLGVAPAAAGLDSRHRPRSQSLHLSMDFMEGCILRNVLVLDLDISASELDEDDHHDDDQPTNELRILPQGRRGLLPNMDLTFVVKAVLERSRIVQQQSKESHVELTVHPYHRQIHAIWEWFDEQETPKYLDAYLDPLYLWGHDMLQLLAFESILALGPYPPHAPALGRGIDAVTIQASLGDATTGNGGTASSRDLSQQQVAMEMVQRMEIVIRALSNLQERLHHSTSLYLLTSRDRFVKHEEYLVPNLLLVIPLILRALHIVFGSPTLFRPNLTSTGLAMALCTAWTVVAARIVTSTLPPLLATRRSRFVLLPDTWLLQNFCEQPYYQHALVYIAILVVLTLFRTKISPDLNSRRSIQFAACLTAAFMHVAIAFGHVSLSFPSALVWTPLLAFPTLRDKQAADKAAANMAKAKSAFILSFKIVLAAVLCPFGCLVPHVFHSYTPYVLYVYIPLHFLFCLLHLVCGGN